MRLSGALTPNPGFPHEHCRLPLGAVPGMIQRMSATPSPERNPSSPGQESRKPLRDEFPPLSAAEWNEQRRLWKDYDPATKLSAVSGVSLYRARELLKRVGL